MRGTQWLTSHPGVQAGPAESRAPLVVPEGIQAEGPTSPSLQCHTSPLVLLTSSRAEACVVAVWLQ